MKKTAIIPDNALNQKIMTECSDSDTYAKKIIALPNEKKSHKVTWVVSTIAACLLVAVGLGIYLKAPKTPWYDELVVEDEIFEKYLPDKSGVISNANRHYPDYDDVDRYFENADLVIIGYPENTFTSDPHAYYSRENGFVTINDDWYTLETIRKIKVLDVLKGELDTDTVNLRVSEVAIWNEDGSYEIKELHDFHFIQKKNVKYLFILNQTDVYNGEKVYYSGFDCCINIDGLHKSSLKEVTDEFFSGIFEKYYDYFVKYDRSDEVEYEPDEKGLYAISGMRYFNNEQDAFDYSDLVIVASPKNDLKDDIRVTSGGAAIADDKEAGKYSHDTVFTLRDMNVLNVIKGDKNITDVYIANNSHYYFDKYTNATELKCGTYTPYEDPITKKDSVYLFYLKRDETLGQNVYRVAGRQCVLNVDGTDRIGGLYRYTTKRLYELYMRNIDIIKQYLPK